MRVEDFQTTAAHPGPADSEDAASGTAVLEGIAQRVRWTAAAIVDAANRGRPNTSGIKVGGHQASSSSMVEIMTSLWFSELTEADRVSVKPHASPVLHAINYLLGDLDENKLSTLRQKGGLQSYPSRSKDPDTVDFSTGSVGIGATATIWAAMSHRFVSDRYAGSRKSGRFIGLLGDAELDEGAIWEAVADPTVAQLGELLWIVDLNRQSLDRVVPDSQITRLQGMFEAAGWQVLTRKWGTRVQELFTRSGGADLQRRLETMPNEEYQRVLRSPDSEIFGRLCANGSTPAMETLLGSLTAGEQAAAVRDLGGHDIGLLLDTYGQVDPTRPTVIFAYTIKGRGLATEGHPNNHSALLTKAQMETLAEASGMDLDDPWRKFQPGTVEERACARTSLRLKRRQPALAPSLLIPDSLPWGYGDRISTQAALGRFLSDLKRAAPEVAHRVVTCSPDVASSTNLGGWINKTGVWSVGERQDWFADDLERVLRWIENSHGQHIELGIAETNLVGLVSELGTTWSRWGQPLSPIATIYDPFRGPRPRTVVLRHVRRRPVHPGGDTVRGDSGTGGRRAPVPHHSVHRLGTAGVHSLGASLRPGSGMVHARSHEPDRHSRRTLGLLPAHHPSTGSVPGCHADGRGAAGAAPQARGGRRLPAERP